MKVSFSYGKSRDYTAKVQKINIRILHGSLDCRRSTGLEISLKDWDTKKHELGNALTGARTPEERTYLNSVKAILDKITATFENEFLQLKLSFRLKSFSNEDWKQWCTDTLNKATGIQGDNIAEVPLLLDKYQDYISYLISDNKAPNTLKGYKSNFKVLKSFEDETRKRYRTDEIDLEWYNKLREWNKARGNNENYFGSIIQKVKAVINHFRSIDNTFRFHPNIDHKKFKTIKINPDHEILTEEELDRLFNYTGKRYLENTRNLAIIQYYACSRWNEIEQEIKRGKEALTIYQDKNGKYFWDILEQKVSAKTKIKKSFPLHKKILDLYHSDNFPHHITPQKFNLYLKEITEELGIDKVITSHTFRRSFCTNMFNDGHDPQEIMIYSGHSTETQLRQYIQKKNVRRSTSIPTE